MTLPSPPAALSVIAASAVLAQEDRLGEGTIDNWIIESSVHVAVGVLVLVSLTAALAWTARLALAGRTLDLAGRATITVAQAVLAVQILLGIKLLDQGQGINQLYIHYLGGLIPLAIFLGAGWWLRADTARRMQLLAGLIAVGWVSAIMAFFIGQEYANR